MKTVILGHARYRTKANTYGHLMSSSLEDAGDQLQHFCKARGRHETRKRGRPITKHPRK